MNPQQRPRHPQICFGFGGRLLIAFPVERAPNPYQQFPQEETVFSISSLNKYFASKPSTALLKRFNGPLKPNSLTEIAAKLRSDELFNFSTEDGNQMSNPISELGKPNKTDQSDGLYLCRHIIALICSHGGVLGLKEKDSKARKEAIELLLRGADDDSSFGASQDYTPEKQAEFSPATANNGINSYNYNSGNQFFDERT